MENDPFSALLTTFIDTIIHRSMGNLYLFSKMHHLSISQLIVLNRLYKGGPASVSILSHTLGISNSAVSQLLEKLVQKELIARWENPEDRRVRYHSISPEGAELVEASRVARHAWIREIHTEMPEGKRVLIADALAILLDGIESLQPVPDCRSRREGNTSC